MWLTENTKMSFENIHESTVKIQNLFSSIFCIIQSTKINKIMNFN